MKRIIFYFMILFVMPQNLLAEDFEWTYNKARDYKRFALDTITPKLKINLNGVNWTFEINKNQYFWEFNESVVAGRSSYPVDWWRVTTDEIQDQDIERVIVMARKASLNPNKATIRVTIGGVLLGEQELTSEFSKYYYFDNTTKHAFGEIEIYITNTFGKKKGKHLEIKSIFVDKKINLSINKYEYSTFYYKRRNVIIPEHLQAMTVTQKGKELLPSKIFNPGDTLPKNEGVIIHGPEGHYTFESLGDNTCQAIKDPGNLLMGTDTLQMISESSVPNSRYYKFSLNKLNEPRSLGFYYGAEGGKPFVNQPHKSYLTLANATAEPRFYLFNLLSGIESVPSEKLNALDYSSGKTFDLSGRPVRNDNLRPGIYIRNGKKILIP